jgi:hypothetical protein
MPSSNKDWILKNIKNIVSEVIDRRNSQFSSPRLSGNVVVKNSLPAGTISLKKALLNTIKRVFQKKNQ